MTTHENVVSSYFHQCAKRKSERNISGREVISMSVRIGLSILHSSSPELPQSSKGIVPPSLCKLSVSSTSKSSSDFCMVNLNRS
mmetsp:Transcript_18222/g.41650  ORF Transcript_18222/g.41650 Transcript_18222/m.41650 type:complete len:84 (-) Transcript_18222:272-523(-)